MKNKQIENRTVEFLMSSLTVKQFYYAVLIELLTYFVDLGCSSTVGNTFFYDIRQIHSQ